MLRTIFLLCLSFGVVAPVVCAEVPLRAPAAPLITNDPYFSVWSFSDRLNESWPNHWTGVANAMAGIIRVDGKAYRFMGPEPVCKDAATQTGVRVLPTRTIYTFDAGPVALTVTFATPLLPNDIKLLSAPVSFIGYDVQSKDGAEHEVAIYFDITAEWVVDKPEQLVTWGRSDTAPGLDVLWFGSREQPILEKKGDNRRIDWGYLNVGVPSDAKATTVVAGHETARGAFRDGATLPAQDDAHRPRAANDDWPVIATVFDLGKVGKDAVSRHLVLGYDDLFSIQYMKQNLKAWWTNEYETFETMLAAVNTDYAAILQRCAAFDDELMADANASGGEQYAAIIALGYRHTWASGKIVVGPGGSPLFFHKENFSNGCIATVDVSYPASPFFALFAPELLKGMLEPIFEFARTPEWGFEFAPHDVGTYPQANGQAYNPGKLEGQMPVEECGNMILMTALVAHAEGNASFAEKHWDLLTKWAKYLLEKGLDPENQLCTDDFAGHLAHNANLSLKAINAIGAYGMLCEMLGKAEGAEYTKAAKEMAVEWQKLADDGDHYRLAFTSENTWSMKYNLVWDDFFGLGIFPDEVAAREIAYYLKVQNKYGLPLDNRKDYTKSDWLVWCASMATTPEDFRALIAPLYTFCNETPDRLPFTDWYDTKTAKCIGFRARPVIGGIFIKILQDNALRAKWQKAAAPYKMVKRVASSEEGFVSLFNGKDLTGWVGDTNGYAARDGYIICDKGKNLFTEGEYKDFVLRLEFMTPPGGNNGVGVRTPLEGRISYTGYEVQTLDDTHEKYKDIKPWQYHGSVYGIVAARPGHLKPAGEWNEEEITVQGPRMKVVLNGITIVDADVQAAAAKNGTLDGEAHEGLKRESGHIGFLGHGDPVAYRNIRVKVLE